MVKIENEDDLANCAELFLAKSDLVIAQEFLPTTFDWRIGILDRQPLYACKYHMVEKHWQITQKDERGQRRYGRIETLPVQQVPRQVVKMALKAANLIGNGLYGVDMKQIGRQCFVIEVNDNPNIDAGFEDDFLKEELYDRIMDVFLERIEQRKAGRGLRERRTSLGLVRRLWRRTRIHDRRPRDRWRCGRSPTRCCATRRRRDYVGEVEHGEIAWSNELVAHVIELKTDRTGAAAGSPCRPRSSTKSRNQRLLSAHGARLHPVGHAPLDGPAGRDAALAPRLQRRLREVRPGLRLPGAWLVQSPKCPPQPAVSRRRRVRPAARGDPAAAADPAGAGGQLAAGRRTADRLAR